MSRDFKNRWTRFNNKVKWKRGQHKHNDYKVKISRPAICFDSLIIHTYILLLHVNYLRYSLGIHLISWSNNRCT